jgi:capsular polysaccharide biosynthesis protein
MLRYGLRRYGVLFWVCVIAGAVLAPLVALQRPVSADAQALVVAQRVDMPYTALPRYAEAVFNNGAVAHEIAARFPAGGPDVIPDRVSMVAEQDAIVFPVVGHDPDPQTAAALANVAAETFVAQLNGAGAGVGLFALQSKAEPPAAKQRGIGTILAIPVGVAAGILLGLAVVGLVLVLRRPVITAADVQETTDVRGLGTVTLPRMRRGVYPRPEDLPGLVPVCRRLLGLGQDTIVLVSQQGSERLRGRIAVALAGALGQVRPVRFLGPEPLAEVVAARQTDDEPDGEQLTLVDSEETLHLGRPPYCTAMVLVAREGIGSGALRSAVVENLGGSAEAAVLLVKRRGRLRRRPEPPAAEREATAEVPAPRAGEEESVDERERVSAEEQA